MLEVNGRFTLEEVKVKDGVRIILKSKGLSRDNRHALTDLEGEDVDVNIGMTEWKEESKSDKKGQTTLPSPINLNDDDIDQVISWATGTQDLRAALACAGFKWDGDFAPAEVLTRSSYETLMSKLSECLVCNCFTRIDEYCGNCFGVNEDGVVFCHSCGENKPSDSEPIVHTEDCTYYNTLQEKLKAAQGQELGPIAVGHYTNAMLEASSRDEAETIALEYSGKVYTFCAGFGVSSARPIDWEKLVEAAKESDEAELIVEFLKDAREAARIFKLRFAETEETEPEPTEPQPVSICSSCEKNFDCPVDVFSRPEFVAEGECVHFQEHINPLQGEITETIEAHSEAFAEEEAYAGGPSVDACEHEAPAAETEVDPFTEEAMQEREHEEHLQAPVLVAPEPKPEPEGDRYVDRMKAAETLEQAGMVKFAYEEAIREALADAGEEVPKDVQAFLSKRKMVVIVGRVFNNDKAKGVLLRKLTNDAYAANEIYHINWGGKLSE